MATTATNHERASFSWRIFVGFLVINAVVLLAPPTWRDGTMITLLGVFALFCLTEAVITLVRTRWYFRVIMNVAEAAVVAGVACAWTLPSSPWITAVALLFAFVLVALVMKGGRPLERRWYPSESAEFDRARASVGRWGVLKFDHIPRLETSAN